VGVTAEALYLGGGHGATQPPIGLFFNDCESDTKIDLNVTAAMRHSATSADADPGNTIVWAALFQLRQKFERLKIF
jgi:hypothetical protein